MSANKRKILSAQQRLDRDTQALELRLAGVDYDTIAKRLGYAARSHAYEAINKLLEQRVAEPTEALRKVEAERLDKLMLAHWNAASKGDERKTALILKLMDRRARLLGLDAPTQTQSVNISADQLAQMTDEELDAFIAQISRTSTR